MKRTLASLSIAVVPVFCLAGTAFGQSDFYIRSQYSNGDFTGSHEILAEPKEGFHEAHYCGRAFWVSSATVAWTEVETEAGRNLVVEENVESGRKVVCADQTAFATLEDLDLNKWEVDKIRRGSRPPDMKSGRIRTIREAFKTFK